MPAPTYDLRWQTDKYAELSDWILDRGVESVVDVGCRDGVLGRTMAQRSGGRTLPRYFGVDFVAQEGSPVSVLADLSVGLPFDDGAADMVVALDVVEHLDDFQGGLEEIYRVSRRFVGLTLPNMAHGVLRAKFFLQGRIGGKYDLRYGYGKDRHRWMTVLDQTDCYLETFARETGSRLTCIHLPLSGRRSGPVERTLSVLRFDPSWYVWVTLYLLEKPGVHGTGGADTPSVLSSST
jgi:SAM-dependent methyltransferase